MPASDSAFKPSVVLTVDDHPLMRGALREVLCAAAESVELLEAADPEEGLALLRQRTDVDLILLDLNFTHHDGMLFVEEYRRAAPLVPVIIYTMQQDLSTLRRVLGLGVSGVIPKTHSRALLQKAIEIVMEGSVYVPPELAPALAAGDGGAAAKAGAGSEPMSEQQYRILELLARGSQNKEIAGELGIAGSTVKNHLTAIFQRLGVSNRTQAALAAQAWLKRGRR